jgi:hypothetical protein
LAQTALAACRTAASAGVERWQLSQGICTCTCCQGSDQTKLSSRPLLSVRVRCSTGSSFAMSTTSLRAAQSCRSAAGTAAVP